MWRYFIGLIGLLLTLNGSADEFSYIGVMETESKENYTLEFGARGNVNPYTFITGSYVWLNHHEELYRGLNTSINVSLGSAVKVYVGAGMFLGKYRPCDEQESHAEEECTDNYVLATYPEAGLQLSLAQMRLGWYGRYYQVLDHRDSHYPMMGMYFGWAL